MDNDAKTVRLKGGRLGGADGAALGLADAAEHDPPTPLEPVEVETERARE